MQTGLILLLLLFSFLVCVKIRLVFYPLCVYECVGDYKAEGVDTEEMGVTGVHAAKFPSNQ